MDLIAIVPAGGAGTRLWPLSRRRRPKFLLDVTGSGRTLLQSTWDRLTPLTGDQGIYVVTGKPHAPAVSAQLGLAEANLLTEPSPRDSMAAIGLAAAVIEHRHGPQVVGSFAADHVVPDTAAFAQVVRTAVAAAQQGYVTTIGITATAPSTAFGYIERGGDLATVPGAFAVTRFVEKPDEETAQTYLDSGRFSWNAGMFVTRTDVLLRHLERHQGTLAAGLRDIAAVWDTAARERVLAEVWPGLTRIAIDHAIAEPVAAEGGVAVVPGGFAWDDVGDWDALGELVAPGGDGVHRVGQAPREVVALDSPGAVVSAPDLTVALVGVPGVAVVSTPDALLVLDRSRAQDVKAVVDGLRGAGREDLL